MVVRSGQGCIAMPTNQKKKEQQNTISIELTIPFDFFMSRWANKSCTIHICVYGSEKNWVWKETVKIASSNVETNHNEYRRTNLSSPRIISIYFFFLSFIYPYDVYIKRHRSIISYRTREATELFIQSKDKGKQFHQNQMPSFFVQHNWEGIFLNGCYKPRPARRKSTPRYDTDFLKGWRRMLKFFHPPTDGNTILFEKIYTQPCSFDIINTVIGLICFLNNTFVLNIDLNVIYTNI